MPDRVIVSAESYQNEVFANWSIAHDQAYVVGDFVWSAMDYLGEAGIGRVFPPDEPVVKHWEGNQFPWHGAYCGDIDLTGWRKPISHYRNVVWDRGERLYATVLTPTADGRPWNISPWAVAPSLPSWTWPGHEGKLITVEVYSRHERVRLTLDGRVIGEKSTTRAEAFKAAFTLPFQPGVLVASGLRDGNEVESQVIQTAGAATQLKVTVDRTKLRADGQDLAFVTLELVDVNGIWNPSSEAVVHCEVTGAGALVALGTADLSSTEPYSASSCQLYQGRGLAVIRVGDKAGDITLNVSANGLPPTRVTLRAAAR